ncbi:hypothetical protein EJV47_17425 [Hymenobacter gummosus]|uniref:Lipocalin-like domain-containing protein n=1 Tax=Hymenobacter gummosus TaxID=1776032 RepID=A0A431U098_9BACT|nr:hypothetical protein [Hymenobacter gummosus]RTQ48210.1 hypothetical protein EJV47_17425 [Hymenobacter gummosus]
MSRLLSTALFGTLLLLAACSKDDSKPEKVLEDTWTLTRSASQYTDASGNQVTYSDVSFPGRDQTLEVTPTEWITREGTDAPIKRSYERRGDTLLVEQSFGGFALPPKRLLIVELNATSLHLKTAAGPPQLVHHDYYTR